ncbi:MAG: hypothetical protein DDT32_01233 [Syntrophomonadaceae bacterium]|nr:hypothetical protein [Bacillota bacterium]
MVSDKRTHLNFTGIYKTPLYVNFYRRIVVPKIAGRCYSADVDPLTEIAVTKKATVIFIRIALNDGVFHLPADTTKGTNGGSPADVAGMNMCFLSYVSRSLYPRVRQYYRLLINYNCAIGSINNNKGMKLCCCGNIEVFL